MKFKSKQIKGKGRGRLLGYPTINLEIPQNFNLEDGIYAVKVFTREKEFIGAMHYGPIPVFKENKKTLEVFLIDIEYSDIPNSKVFEIETLKYLRPVLNFPSQEELVKQIGKDVNQTREIAGA